MRETLDQKIIADADRCVKCAVCLPHCPTYAISGDESESPRGRIALMRAMADESQPPDAGLTRHLDQCLTCRNCEPVCPAGVRYGRLIDNARARLAESRPPGRLKRLGLWLVTRPRWLRALAALLRTAQVTGLTRLLPAAQRLPRLGPATRLSGTYPARDEDGGRVQLFLGCVARVLDARTLADTVKVLTASGVSVTVPGEQTCCGALHRHAGQAQRADGLAAHNRDAFAGADRTPVVSAATGCGCELTEHVLPDDHSDICAWLDRRFDNHPPPLHALNARIVVHAPCTQRNGLHQGGMSARLLRRIPGVEVIPAPAEPKCCGAAGSYVLEHRDKADRLGRELAERIAAEKPHYVASANIGCAMHLADHLRRLGSNAELLHPVSLVARRLKTIE